MENYPKIPNELLADIAVKFYQLISCVCQLGLSETLRGEQKSWENKQTYLQLRQASGKSRLQRSFESSRWGKNKFQGELRKKWLAFKWLAEVSIYSLRDEIMR